MGLKQTIKSAFGAVRCRLSGAKAGKGVYVGSDVHIVNGRNVTLSDGVQVRPGCDLFAGGGGIMVGPRSDIGERNRIDGDVVIGEAVLFGPDNYISSVDHCFEDVELPVMDQGCHAPSKDGHENLRIGDGSWVGCHCAIVGCVHIGKHCVIGANSVVTRDLPDNCVAAGVPAKILKRYDVKTGRWVREG